jgi:hypothetical protein
MAAGHVSSMLRSFDSSLENDTFDTAPCPCCPSALAMFVSHFPHLSGLSNSAFRLPRKYHYISDLHRGFGVDIVSTHPRGD